MVQDLFSKYPLDPPKQEIKLEGYSRMEKLAHAVTILQEGKKDVWILVTGDLGDGKSTVSWELARLISKYNNMKCSLEDNMLFNPSFKQINDKIYSVPHKTVLQLDDASTLVHARNWNTTDQIEFTITCDRIRYRQLCVIVNIRMLKEVDILFRNGRFFYWIDILTRGKAAVFARDASYSLRSKGDAFNSELLLEKMENLPINDISARMDACESMTNFRGFLYFRPFGAPTQKKYDELKEKSDILIYEKNKERAIPKEESERLLNNSILALYNNTGFSPQEIADKINEGNQDKIVTAYKVSKLVKAEKRRMMGENKEEKKEENGNGETGR